MRRLISRYAAWQVELGGIAKENQEAYEYGYYLMLLEAADLLIMLFIGLIFRCPVPLA